MIVLVGFIVLAMLCVLALLALGAAVVCRILLFASLLRRHWHFIALVPFLMGLVPAWLIRVEQIRLADCFSTFGPDDHFCSGEVGGFIRDGVEWGALFGSIVVGPFVGRFLALKWLGTRSRGNK